MKKKISEALSERLKNIQKLGESDTSMLDAYQHMIQTFNNIKIAIIDKIIGYPDMEFANETYEKRARQLLLEYVALDRMYVDRTGEEPLFMDNDPTRLVKLFTLYESEKIWA